MPVLITLGKDSLVSNISTPLAAVCVMTQCIARPMSTLVVPLGSPFASLPITG